MMASVRQKSYLRAMQSRPIASLGHYEVVDHIQTQNPSLDHSSQENMAPMVPGEVVFTHDKKAKEKVRKCGTSAKRKALQLGKGARVFSAVIHFNPTYGQLDGAVHIPEGQSMPDVNEFVSRRSRS